MSLMKPLGVFLLGVLLMGSFQWGGCVYTDLRFLHKARLDYEAQLAKPKPAPKPQPPVTP